MDRLFSPDSGFSRTMNRIGDLIALNLLFLLSCLPIFTIGAARTALYAVCFPMGSPREGALRQTYFKAFQSGFRQATGLFLLLILLEGIALYNVLVFWDLGGAYRIAALLFALLGLIAMLTDSLLFPLISCSKTPWQVTLKNAALLSLGRLPRAAGLTLLRLLPLLLYGFAPELFLLGILIFISIYFSAAALLGARLLKPVFQIIR